MEGAIARCGGPVAFLLDVETDDAGLGVLFCEVDGPVACSASDV